MVADAAPVEQFGPYLVYERLGVGGMATVHRALERGIEGFERIVALKRLLPHLAEDASFIKSFVREAKLASLLNHVNIVQLFELGRVGTEYFISMEYIDGRDIRRVLRHARRVTGPPPLHVTVGLLLQLCDALEYAHTKVDEHGHPLGLVHRDVSPSNLLVTRTGIVKVIDFGIAKAQSSQLRTQTGRVKGKLAYMAPEAVAGKDLDSRSDLFAAGVVAHELLTARPLFASKNEYQTLLKLQRGDIMPPSTFNQACPPELDAIVLKALAREPSERYSTAAELREQLHALRRRLNLQTGHRDIAQWLEWAASIEPPSGDFATVSASDPEASGDLDRTVAARPRAGLSPSRVHRDEEDAAIEHAWGSGEAELEVGPVVLEDVPDVSDKHRAATSGDGAAGDDADLDDDIPAPQPSHGLAPRPRARARKTSSAAPALLGAPQRPTIVGHGPQAPLPASRTPLRPATFESAAADPASQAAAALAPARQVPQGARASTGPIAPAIAVEPPQVPPEALSTMRDLPPLPARGRVRAESIAPRELPSLEPFLAPQPEADADADAGAGAGAGTGGHDDEEEPDLLRTARRPRRPPIRPVTLGPAVAAPRPSRGRWIAAAGVFIAGAIGASVVSFMAGSGGDKQAAPIAKTAVAPEPAQAPPVPARTTGTLKFVIVPEDAEITVEGHVTHQGSPWATELPAGVHQISIQRSGYKAWLTSLELSPNESQLLRVVLEPLGAAASTADATLILSTTPSGLEVLIDGQVLPQRTPLRVPVRPGRHVVTVRQNGVEVWRHQLDARSSVDYEFSPSMAADKQRERAARASEVPAPDGGAAQARPSSADGDRGEQASAPGAGASTTAPADSSARRIESPSLPAIPTPTPTPTPPATPPVTPQPPVRTAPPAAPAAPALVPSSWVTRTGGDVPTLTSATASELPATVAAKLCIDTAGRVTSVQVSTKLERETARELTRALESWTYEPYKRQGVVVPVCFVASLRTK